MPEKVACFENFLFQGLFLSDPLSGLAVGGESQLVVVKIRVPFWVLNIIRHLIFGVPKKRPSF